MKRKTRINLNFTTEHAANALRILIADGKLKASDVVNALKRREQMIHDLRWDLAALEGGEFAKIASAGRRVTRKVGGKAKRKMSAARRAALKLHGKYIGSVRTLPKAAKAKIKTIREKAGVHAAIAAAKKMAK